jgi:ABC-type nitrate/sulfonate/bicarbonate transport system substrate-binding protein
LNGEGFTDVQHQPPDPTGALREVASGTADIGITFSGPTIIQIDGGDQITILAGVHPGCFELFGTQRVRSLKDLKGKKIAVNFCCVAAANREFVRKHPVATKRALRAFMKADRHLRGGARARGPHPRGEEVGDA